MSENNNKNINKKDLNEKDIEKVSGGKFIDNAKNKINEIIAPIIYCFKGLPPVMKYGASIPELPKIRQFPKSHLKNLEEKDVEKVSGGQKIDPKFYENHPQLLAYGGPEMFRPKKYGGPPIIKPKEKTSNLNEVKNLQPFSDEDNKNKN